MKYLFIILLILQFSLSSCSKLRESAGVNRKSLDEFQVIENPPLVIPPDFNLLPPEKLEKKNIENIEKDLAEEILFGLEESVNNNPEQLSPMNQILKNMNADSEDSDIRNEINEVFANETKTDSLLLDKWENEDEILNAVEESERVRKKLIEGESLSDEEFINPQEEIKPKKKKRFFFF